VESARYTVNCSILLTELALLDRPRAAREAGFTAVEFWWPFDSPTPPDAEVSAFIQAVEDAGVQLSGLNFAAGDMGAGDRGLLSDPSAITAFRDNVDVAVGIAEALGTRAFNALYGNRDETQSAAAQDAVAEENLAFAAHAAARIGGTVLIEPVSGAPLYPLKTAADAVAVMDRVHHDSGATNIRLLADLYHLCVNGDDISAAIATFGHRVGHVQIADAPGRAEPGTGHISIDDHLRQLWATGYDGYIGLEYKATQPDPFAWLAPERRGATIPAARSSSESRNS